MSGKERIIELEAEVDRLKGVNGELCAEINRQERVIEALSNEGGVRMGDAEGAFEGFEAMEMPMSTRVRRSRPRELVESFIASGEECAGKRYGSVEDAYKEYYSVYRYIRRHGIEDVKAVMRGDTFLLVRAV